MSKQKSKKRTVKYVITITTNTDFKEEFIENALRNLIGNLRIGLYGKNNKIEIKSEKI